MLKRAAFWLLLPVIVIQGLAVRYRARRFAAPAGPVIGQVAGCGGGPPLRLLALGDSIVAGVGAGSADNALAGATARALAQLTGRSVQWQGHGRIGAGIADLADALLPSLAPAPFDVVVLSVGVNDITRLRRSGTWARRLAALLDRLRARDPEAIIAMAGMPPLHGFPLLPVPLRGILGMRARSFSHAARRVVESRPGMVFVPLDFDPLPDNFCDDGFHPGPASYSALGLALAQSLAAQPGLAAVSAGR
jgi:lysophospholipase L1-like esterase